VYIDDDPARPLRYPSDFAYYKPKADIVVSGSFHAPGRRPVVAGQAQIAVGDLSKTVMVVGNRYWTRGLMGASATVPEAFTQMDLSYANSFGGPGFPTNPAGKGLAETIGPDGAVSWPLPNVENPAELIARPDSRPSPAGFGPCDLMSPQRIAKAGTYDDKWKAARWPWFPEDFDWGFFNAAPPDQQVEGFLKGDERVQLVNLHPDYSIFDAFLPHIRARCFYSPVVGAPLYFREVPLNLDTVWIDTEKATLVLVWRGAVTLRGDNLGKQDRLLIVSESMTGQRLAEEHYEQLCLRLMRERAIERDEDDTIDEDDAIAVTSVEAGGSEIPAGSEQPADEAPEVPMAIAGSDDFDREAATEVSEPEPVSRGWCVAHYACGGSFEGLDLAGVDLSDVSLPGARFNKAILTGAYFRRANLRGADFSAAILSDADLTDADLSDVQMSGADCTHARLVRCSMERANLTGADFTEAVLRQAQMAGVEACKVILAGANLLEADLTGAQLTDADLSRASLHMVTLIGSTLRNASIEGASGFPVVADEADLRGLRAANAILWESSFRYSLAEGSIWQAAELRDSDFTGANLAGAEFEDASLERADFTCAVLRHARLVRADLRGARMVNSDLFGASLEKADLMGASLAYSNLFSAEFLDTALDYADLSHANIKRTTLVASS